MSIFSTGLKKGDAVEITEGNFNEIGCVGQVVNVLKTGIVEVMINETRTVLVQKKGLKLVDPMELFLRQGLRQGK